MNHTRDGYQPTEARDWMPGELAAREWTPTELAELDRMLGVLQRCGASRPHRVASAVRRQRHDRAWAWALAAIVLALIVTIVIPVLKGQLH